MVTTDDLDKAISYRPPSLHRRADRMFREIARLFDAGKTFSINQLGPWKSFSEPGIIGGNVIGSRLVPLGWNKSVKEMEYMVENVIFRELGHLSEVSPRIFQISPKGLLYLEGQQSINSKIGFCAMWFSPEVLPLWTDVIEPAIRESGYEPLRIDGKEHNGKIDDEIMASIRGSKFVVSDFTGSRGGVYYEAGFAHGLGLPVIFMFREGDALHFDVRQYNCIFWTPEELPEARSRLKNRILATLGQGPLKTQ